MPNDRSEIRRRVVAFNRDRDGYQVPLALQEADWLEALVTDYYAPKQGGIKAIRHRHVVGLPCAKVRSNVLATALQALGPRLKLDPTTLFTQVDVWLSQQAARVAGRSPSADLLLYSKYAYEVFY